MWTTPKKQTKRRETLRNANQNKTSIRAGYKVYGKKKQKNKQKQQPQKEE